MNRLRTSFTLLLVLLSLSGCFLRHASIEDRILGRWQTELAGFPVVVEYTSATVGIGSYPPVPYTLNGDVISFEFQGTQSRRVAFPAEDVMVQRDLTTGIERTFARVTE